MTSSSSRRRRSNDASSSSGSNNNIKMERTEMKNISFLDYHDQKNQ
jgi:hypothetical protein